MARPAVAGGGGAVTLAVALRHRFGTATLDIAFDVPTPGVTALFGPSGVGKSSVLAAIAGLLRPDACRVTLDGERLADTEAGIWQPTERRRVGFVFQDARLFPHLSVAANLRYGLRRAGAGATGFDEVVALLGLSALLARRPHTLSGGERQRVAIGRALLAQPRLLLMDEPLASLDAARKDEILPYLARLDTALRLPILYVTHALDEVAQLADSVVLLAAGRVELAPKLATGAIGIVSCSGRRTRHGGGCRGLGNRGGNALCWHVRQLHGTWGGRTGDAAGRRKNGPARRQVRRPRRTLPLSNHRC